ncbi:MAG: Gfo/Idh/MocA family oxidoreductase [Patescibacteria group bacterium]|nr:Gfo/Idh/MocA family oxidoreductase [Patescibacteria group bacterium]
MMEKVRVGIIGSQFAATLHVESYRRCQFAEIVAVASIDNPERFARQYEIPQWYTDYRALIERKDIDLVSLCVPNFLHAEIAGAVAGAGKHIICEKPLATSIDDGKKMIEVCKHHGVMLMYAEDWIFAPALIRAKQIYDEKAIGKVLYIKAKETHSGSHSPYALNKNYCGGGALIHLGVHPIGFCRWFTGQEVMQVQGMVSGGGEKNLLQYNCEGEDWAAALLAFADGTRGFVEGNYVTCGGMDDRIEIYGSEGNLQINLTQGSPISVYSRKGYGYAIEKTDFTTGWTKPAVDELWSLGYPGEIAHFVDCVRNDVLPQPGVRGEDGLKALQIIDAIYKSAETGNRIEVSLNRDF